jgi:4-diphosphocytidyl-2-C-methyl-D-erythritol kinase
MNLHETPFGSPEPWPAPGKLNLFLHVVGRRRDGYHLLQTGFQFIDLCDELSFWQRPPGVVERVVDLPGVPVEVDLTLRAARALMAGRPGLPGVAIEVRKRLPIQGGVGGGSSDAATVLVALNQLWGLGLTTSELAAIGLKLGADVPVFVHGHAAWAVGVGEILTPVEFPERRYLLIQPDASVSTAEIFQAPELKRDSPPITIRGFLTDGGRNDCEPVVRARCPEVAEALDWLSQHAPARLTGTGACLFAPFDDERDAAAVAGIVPARWTAYVVQGLNQSPLVARSRREGEREVAAR